MTVMLSSHTPSHTHTCICHQRLKRQESSAPAFLSLYVRFFQFAVKVPASGFPIKVPASGFPVKVPASGFPAKVPVSGFADASDFIFKVPATGMKSCLLY